MKRLMLIFMTALAVSMCCRGQRNVFIITDGAAIDGLHAPWDGLDDDTRFRCFTDQDFFYFFFEVNEPTLTLTVPYTGERDVDPEDRVEVFFSPREEMDIYYCAEIDPAGNIMDYEAKYYREFDYDWDFDTMEVMSRIEDDSYIVSGRVSRKELTDLGIDLEKGFRMGVFRADFRPDGSVNWYSAVPTADKSPDFHKPDLLFSAALK